MSGLKFEILGLNAGRLSGGERMGCPHHHQEVEINHALKGRVTYLHRGRPLTLESGRTAIFWGAMPHVVSGASREIEMLWITVPLPTVLSWDLPGSFMKNLLAGACQAAQLRARSRFPFSSWVEELGSGDSALREGILWELRGCVTWFARKSSRTEASAAEPTGEFYPVERMVRHMSESYLEPIGVPEVAAAAALHPNYAMNLFRRRCGITIGNYITNLRIAHAQRLLITSRDKVTDIAMQSGFESLSAFYEAFNKILGVTPGVFRGRFSGQQAGLKKRRVRRCDKLNPG